MSDIGLYDSQQYWHFSLKYCYFCVWGISFFFSYSFKLKILLESKAERILHTPTQRHFYILVSCLGRKVCCFVAAKKIQDKLVSLFASRLALMAAWCTRRYCFRRLLAFGLVQIGEKEISLCTRTYEKRGVRGAYRPRACVSLQVSGCFDETLRHRRFSHDVTMTLPRRCNNTSKYLFATESDLPGRDSKPIHTARVCIAINGSPSTGNTPDDRIAYFFFFFFFFFSNQLG